MRGSGNTPGATGAESREAAYQRKKAEIRANPELSWERKEREIKVLGEEHHRRLKELERGAA